MGRKKLVKRKNPAAVALVSLRHASLTPERRSAIARMGAAARWGKTKIRKPKTP